MPKVPRAVSAYMVEQQLKSAAAIKGTPAAASRASKAGRSVSSEAAKLRAQKAAAARHAKKK